MRNFELNKNSWHYKAAQFGTVFGVPDETNFCKYFWMVLKGVLLHSIIFVFMFGFGSAILFSIGNVIMHFLYGWEMTQMAEGVLVGLLIGGSFLGFLVAKKQIEKMANAAVASQSMTEKPGFLYMTYLKFKDKTCFKINFK